MWQDVKTSATGSPYRLDERRGRPQLRAQLAVGRGEPARGEAVAARRPHERRCSAAAGRASLFLDAEARHEFGKRLEREPDGAARLDRLRRRQVPDRRLRLRPRQGRGARRPRPARPPHRATAAGRAWRLRDVLPTSYDYATGTATNSLSTMSLSPSGRELDAELSYGSACSTARHGSAATCSTAASRDTSPTSPDDVGAAVRFSLGF